MEQACAAPAAENPGALLAAWIADSHAAGRDKLTLVFSERFAPLGLWIEQLVAESLGKDDTGVVPIVEHDPHAPDEYDDDRAIVVVRLTDDEALAAWSREAAAVHPVFELTVADVFDLASEFVRWEHAVALAGFLLGVNPFDEPAVTEAKNATTAILEDGGGSVPKAQADFDGTWITYAGGLVAPATPAYDRIAAVRVALSTAGPLDYLALLAYLPEAETRLAPLRAAVAAVARATGRAATLGLGPRYLHSTGQLHKGGPNAGVFVLVTARDRVDLGIPGKQFGLAALHRAQAEGDLVTLAAHDRRVLRVDLPSSDAAVLEAFAADLVVAASL
jgi:hypothetical protein